MKRISTEEDIKKLFIKKYNNKEFKFDKKTSQKFIEIECASFEAITGYIINHNHHVTDPQWYIDNYEPLMKWQIPIIVDLIKEDHNTRQAYISMLHPNDYHYENQKICTIGMQVIYNEHLKEVDYIVFMRSNNICEHTQDFRWQAKIWCLITNMLIKELNDPDITLGHMYWNAGSLHLYEEDFKWLI